VFGKKTMGGIALYQHQARNTEEEAKVFTRWEKEGSRKFEARGYRITGVKRLTQPTTIVCLEMSQPEQMPEVSCMFAADRVMADYRGLQAGVVEFYDFLSTARLAGVP
jgi:hypothetical protein